MSTPSITEATTSAPNIQSLHPGFSIAGRRRRTLRFAAVTIALALTAAALWVAMILVGETWYSTDEVLAVLSGDIVPGASFDVGEIRLPRAIIGLLAGMAFGMAGTTSQTMLRNQLASPDIIGITSGASASAVFAILVLGWSPAGIGVNILAIACGLGTALTIFLLSGQGRSQGGRLILIGIGVSAMFTSLISYLQLQGNVYKAIEAMRWLSGSLDSVSWNQVPVLAAAMAVCGALLLVIGRDLGPLTLGEETPPDWACPWTGPAWRLSSRWWRCRPSPRRPPVPSPSSPSWPGQWRPGSSGRPTAACWCQRHSWARSSCWDAIW